MSNFKIYVSGYIEKTQQLLVSFSSDKTKGEAEDYPALAFDIVPYGNVTAQEVVTMIARTAPSIIADTLMHETYTDTSEKAESLKALVGNSFTFTEEELFPPFVVASEVDEI